MATRNSRTLAVSFIECSPTEYIHTQISKSRMTAYGRNQPSR